MIKFKVEKYTHDFTMIQNDLIRDNDLSFADMGLLIWLLSKPDGWHYTVNGTVAARGGSKSASGGRDKIMRLMKDLEAAGYLRRERERDSAGRMTGHLIYTVYEVKQLSSVDSYDRKSDLPTVGMADSRERRQSANPAQPITDIRQSTESLPRKDNNRTDVAAEAKKSRMEIIRLLVAKGINLKNAERYTVKKSIDDVKQAIAAADHFAAHNRVKKSYQAILASLLQGTWSYDPAAVEAAQPESMTMIDKMRAALMSDEGSGAI